jgi:hypothetical protein
MVCMWYIWTCNRACIYVWKELRFTKPAMLCTVDAKNDANSNRDSVMYATAKDAVVVIIVLVGFIVSIYQL